MGRNSNYFRHAFEAHNDIKMQELIDRGGLKAVGAYFILLEIFGRHVAENDIDLSKTCSAELHIRRIATAFRLRTDSTRTVIELIADCKLIDPVHFKLDCSSVQVGIPNFWKYFGSYKKTEQPKKTYKIKENKIKENKINTLPAASADGLAPQEILHQVKKSKPQSDEKKLVAKSVRENYISAYQNRYGVKPTWAAKENSLALKLIERIGQQESLELSQKYLTYQDPWHCQQKHPFGLLVSQLDKIRVELNNPLRMLDSQIAKTQLNTQAEKSQKEISQERITREFLSRHEDEPEEIDYDQE